MQNNLNQQKMEYAGFWVRLAAYLIDGIIVLIGLGILNGFLSVIPLFTTEVVFDYTISNIIGYLCESAYFIVMTYLTGATIGKMILKLKVVSVKDSGKLRLFDVIYRETIGRYLSGVSLMIGYFMAGFTEEKKALHDILCDTRVMKEKKVYQPYVPYGYSQPNAVQPEATQPEAAQQEEASEHEVSEEIVAKKENVSTPAYEYTMVDPQLNSAKIQENVDAQWNRILNPQEEKAEEDL